jgi:hypothetical protein
MEDYEKLGIFYLGRRFDPDAGAPLEPLMLYPSKNLTTHALCLGMTGSGKTGLCLGLIEEAAIDQIPVLAIDPKGDLANLLLTFDPLAPEAFAPWVEPGSDPAAVARTWREGLAASGQDEARVGRLRDAADFAVYTPGSSAGLPLSIVSSLAAPKALDDADALREKITTTVAGLLALAGVDADPVKSREFVLIANLVERTWRAGQDLDLAGLIQQLQQPPIKQVGALDLESFFPAKDRFTLAMTLNQLLASPTFAAWREGDPLDVQRLLYTPEGKPRVSIVSIAHLGDAERMFVVTQIFNAVLGWVRAQSGTSSLRAILYMDEVAGYLPPVAAPPSKAPLLTLLKQARAFGLGVVLASQNPVDLDYKALANAGTWFIGRLQTERDKARVMEGLEGAAGAAGQPFDRGRMERLLARLGNRVFLLNDVRADRPVAFQTRWTLSYLRGPLSRDEIKRLMAGRKSAPAPQAPQAMQTVREGEAETRPVLPAAVTQHFAPGRTAVYDPHFLAALSVRFTAPKLGPKPGIDHTVEGLTIAPVTEGPIAVDFNAATELPFSLDQLGDAPAPEARFSPLPAEAAQPKSYPRWGKELVAWMLAHQVLELWQSPSTGEVSQPGESEGDFRARLQHESHEDRDRDVEKLRARYATRLSALDERIRKAQQASERESDRSRAAQLDTALDVGTSLLGALFGGRSSTRSITSGVRRAGRAVQKGREVARARETVATLEAQRDKLQEQIDAEVAELAASRDPQTELFERVEVRPRKADVNVRHVALLWLPRS